MQIPIEKCTVDKTARRQLIIIQKMEEKQNPATCIQPVTVLERDHRGQDSQGFGHSLVRVVKQE